MFEVTLLDAPPLDSEINFQLYFVNSLYHEICMLEYI